ncbi:MAG: DUF3833 family protein [Rhizobium sp.]
MRYGKTLIVAALLQLATIAGASAADLRLEDYFAGHTVAVGHFGAINGVSRDFKVNLTGTSSGKLFSLREDFRYADGEKDRKTWRFTRTGPTTYRGTREDVVGDTEVKITGQTARFTYLVNLTPNGKANIVRFHDSMVVQKDGSMINNAWVTKYGFPVARTHVVFTRKR